MAGQKPGGVGILFGPVDTLEVHTSTCAHCQRVTDIPSMRVIHEYVDVCRNCMKLICLECAGKPCVPWMKRVEEEEAAYQHRVALGLAP